MRIKPIKLSFRSMFLLLTFFLVLSPLFPIQGVTSEWSSSITTKHFRWKALKSELRDLKTQEQYRETYLIGGRNFPGGINTILLLATPPNDFNFFNGSRLDLDVTIEGDMGIDLSQYGSDFHLLLLPIRINNGSFFEVLFEEIGLLENLTHSIYLNSSITAITARSYFKYNDVHDVLYEWDIATGILVRKEVTAPSGLQLILVPTSQISIQGWNFPIVLITVLIVIYWHTKREA